MGDKIVCLNCRESFSTGSAGHVPDLCPKCGSVYILYNHKFRPPKKGNLKSWKVISYLYDHGFIFQHVYKDLTLYRWHDSENHAEYPKTLDEAKEFVLKFKSQAKKSIK
jgi:predicted  nucleic acid-binding Zn-ribbon protein